MTIENEHPSTPPGTSAPAHGAGALSPAAPRPARGRPVVAWLLVVVASLGLIAALGVTKFLQISGAIAAAMAMPEPSETVEPATVETTPYAPTTRAVGTIVAQRRVDLRNELAGTITQVGFRSGAIVEKGQVLLRLDTSREEAELAGLRAQARLARQTLDRRQALVRRQTVSEAETDRAEAELAQAEANIRRLEAEIAKMRLVAPFRARVGMSDWQPGAYLSEGTLVAALEGLSPDAYVDFALTQDDAAAQRVGGTVTISGTGLPPEGAPATISAIAAAIDPATRTVPVRATLAGWGERLRPGAFVDVAVALAEPQPALTIPLTSVRRSPYGDHVFRLDPQSRGEEAPLEPGTFRARQQFVRLGPVLGGRAVIVLEGLEAGAQIAAAGSFKLREGLLVRTGTARPPVTGDGGPAPVGLSPIQDEAPQGAGETTQTGEAGR